MKPKTLILMVVAVSCGLGASYMTSRLLADRGDSVEKVTILVAKKNLNYGESIKTVEEMFDEKALAKGEEPRLAISDPEKLKGRMLKRALRTGDFITSEDLLDEKSSVGNILTNLPPEHVACGIRVSPENIAGGFASLPGARINIMMTVRKGDDKGSYSKILLENVLVLAADTATVRTETGGAMPASVVTVALKYEDSLRLELAKQTGTLSLVLRKFNDATLAKNDRLTAEGLLGRAADSQNVIADGQETPGPAPLANVPVTPKEPKAAPKEVAPKSPYTITIREGKTIRQATVESEVTQPPESPGLEGDEPPAAPPAAAPKKDNN